MRGASTCLGCHTRSHQNSTELSDSAQKRARLDADLHMAADLIPQSFFVLKKERKRDLLGTPDAGPVNKLSRKDFSGDPPFPLDVSPNHSVRYGNSDSFTFEGPRHVGL